jgi:hypothetical protein
VFTQPVRDTNARAASETGSCGEPWSMWRSWSACSASWRFLGIWWVGVRGQNAKNGRFSVKNGCGGVLWAVLKSSVWRKTWFECPDACSVRWSGGCVRVVCGRSHQLRKPVAPLPGPGKAKTCWRTGHSLPRKPLTPRIHPFRLVGEEATVAASGRAFRMGLLGPFR